MDGLQEVAGTCCIPIAPDRSEWRTCPGSHSSRLRGVTNFPTLKAPGPIPDGAMRIVPLGGLGEVGRNMTVFEIDGQLLIVDLRCPVPRRGPAGGRPHSARLQLH